MIAPPSSASVITIATIVVLTSVFSLKGLGGTLTAFKAEESAILHKSSSFRSVVYRREQRSRLKKRTGFVICNECFWCASQINERCVLYRCPSCERSNLERMSASLDNLYLLGHEQKS